MNFQQQFQMPQQPGPAGGPKPLVTFKAGRLEAKPQAGRGAKLMVTPDLRKGQLSLVKGADDDLLHFQWRDRANNTVQDDLIIFSDEAEFKRCKTGRKGDRVFLLQMKGNSRRFFYWMQDKDDSKDEANAKRVAELCENPALADSPDAAGEGGSGMLDMFRGGGMGAGAASGAGSGGGTASSAAGQVNMADLQSILQNMGFNAESSSTPPAQPAAAAATPSSQPAPVPTPASNPSAEPPSSAAESAVGSAAGGASQLTTADLQRALASIAGNAGGGRVVPLNDVVQADDVIATGVLEDPEVQAALLPLLAPGQQTVAELREIVRRPQLQQALASLTQALQTDNFNSVVSSFSLDASNPASMEALSRGDGVEALLQALIHAAAQRQRAGPSDGAADAEAKGGDGAGESAGGSGT